MAGELASFFIRIASVFDGAALSKAKDDIGNLDKTVSGVTGTFNKLAGLVAAGGTLWKLGDFAWDSVMAFAEQEAAVNKLASALKNAGVYTRQAVDEQVAFAGALQKITTFSDEVIIRSQALGASFGLFGNDLMNATRAAMNMSTTLDMDLQAATMIVGKAFQGQVGPLTRYVTALKDNEAAGSDFTVVLKAMNAQFGGAAEAAMNTTAGRLENFKNMYGELKEVIGLQLIPVFSFWLDQLTNANSFTMKIVASTGDWLSSMVNLAIGTSAVESLTAAERDNLTVREKTMAALKDHIVVLENKIMADEKSNGVVSTADRIERDRYLKALALEKEKFAAETTNNSGRIIQKKSVIAMEVEGDRVAGVITANEKMRRDEIKRLDEASARRIDDELKERAKIVMQYADLAVNAMSGGISEFIDFTGENFLNFQKFCKNLFDSILKAFFDMVAQMIARWIVLQVITKFFPGLGSLLHFQEGGEVPATGPIFAHAGEYVLPKNIVDAIKRSSAPMGTASAGGGFSAGGIVVNQSFSFGGSGGDQNVVGIMESIRQATRAGVSQALDLGKELYQVGSARASEA